MYDFGTYDAATTTAGAGALAGMNAGSYIISLAYWVLSVVALWKIFEKAGIEGWKSIIPVYNIILVFKKVDLNPWLLLLFLIPCLGWIAVYVLTIVAYARLAKQMGQESGAFVILIIFFSPIALAVLAFDKKYQFK